jgi:hypothetical protein
MTRTTKGAPGSHLRRAVLGISCVAAVGACAAAAEPPAAPPPNEPPPAAAAPAPPASAPPPASAVSLASASAGEPADFAEPLEIEYPFRGLETLPADCKEPSVVLTTAPTKMGWDYDWMWTRQALLANPQFAIVDWPKKPEKAMQLRLDMYEIPGGFALVGACRDGATCNKLAAMYKSTVPSCSPKLHCGPVPMKGPARRSNLVPADGEWLPKSDAAVIGRCARIGVCLAVKKEKMGRNPGLECQSNPSRFKVDCAKKATCDEVVQCLLAR